MSVRQFHFKLTSSMKILIITFLLASIIKAEQCLCCDEFLQFKLKTEAFQVTTIFDQYFDNCFRVIGSNLKVQFYLYFLIAMCGRYRSCFFLQVFFSSIYLD